MCPPDSAARVNPRRYYVSVWLREVSVVEFWHVNQWIHRRLVAVH
jgi:hypothetical protein